MGVYFLREIGEAARGLSGDVTVSRGREVDHGQDAFVGDLDSMGLGQGQGTQRRGHFTLYLKLQTEAHRGKTVEDAPLDQLRPVVLMIGDDDSDC